MSFVKEMSSSNVAKGSWAVGFKGLGHCSDGYSNDPHSFRPLTEERTELEKAIKTFPKTWRIVQVVKTSAPGAFQLPSAVWLYGIILGSKFDESGWLSSFGEVS